MNAALTLPSIGDLVDGRFRIESKLGEGGTSTVYEVRHVITDKRFAIKWLLPELALDDTAVDRFIHEARVGGKFAHPHAVQVYDICKANDSFYMLMELLEGESLLARLERVGRIDVQESCSIVLACAEVLGAAHRKGIIHRDLKPANIFLSRAPEAAPQADVPKLLDFGISMFCSDLHNISLVTTPRGSVIGTPLYMSPEQMLGRRTDARSDLYALGAVLYELVSGQPPYQADSYGELVVAVTVAARAPSLDELVDVDPAFARVVAKAVARAPDDRYQTAEELSAALRPFATATLPVPSAQAPVAQLHQGPEGAGPHAIELTPAYGTRLRLRGQMLGRVFAGAGTAALCAAVLGAAVWYRNAPREADAAGRPRPRALGAASVEEHAAVESWNRDSSEVLTGRAAPDDSHDTLSVRGHTVRNAGAGSSSTSAKSVVATKKSKSRARAEAEPLAPGTSIAAIDSGPSATRPGALVSSVRVEDSAETAGPRGASIRAPLTPVSRVSAARVQPSSSSAHASSPVEQIQIRRSDFDGQIIPANPPAAHVSRKDF